MSTNHVGGVATDRHGLVTGDSAADMTGRQLLQATVDGRKPQAQTSQVMTFGLVEAPEWGRRQLACRSLHMVEECPSPGAPCLKPVVR
jgi:hypothetical protein